MQTLISPESLHDRLTEPALRIVDCRFSLADESAGEAAFRKSHIPGAQYLHLNHDLSGDIIPGKTGRHPLPTKDEFVKTLRRHGIENGSMVVAYDDASGAFAARLWWMLRWVGHGNVSVLDGGFKAWQTAGFPVTSKTSPASPSDFAPGPSLVRVVEASEVMRSADLLLDARDEARFRGEVEPIDPVAGHIPGAQCASFAGNLENDRMRSVESLRERFNALGVKHDSNVICYCGSGVTAAHNILAMVHAGFNEPALYPGSWSEWITDPARPVERE